MKIEDIAVGMKVKKITGGGPTGEYIKEPTYTVTDINEYGDVEYTVKGGKRWACHPSYLVPGDTPSGPI